MRLKAFPSPRLIRLPGRKTILRMAAMGILAVFLRVEDSPAANDLYWDTNGPAAGSGSATGTWGSSNFWNTDPTGGNAGVFTAGTTNLNDVHFSAGASGSSGTVTVSGAQAANRILFEQTGNITVSGGSSLTLGGGAGVNPGITVGAGSGTVAISTGLVLGGSATTVANNDDSTLSIGGGVSGSGSITNVGTGTGAVTISGVIGSNVTGITQDSATSALTLNPGTGNTSTFSGPIQIKAGILNIGTSSALGMSTNLVTLGDAATGLDATLRTVSNGTFTNPITAAAGAGKRSIINGGTSTAGISGAITLANDLAVGSSVTNPLRLSGGISGLGNITVNNTGAGASEFRSTANHTGAVTNVSTGTGGAAFVTANSIGANATELIQNSATSAMSVQNSNSAFTGTIQVLAGRFILGVAGSISNGSGIDVSAGAIFDTTAQSYSMLGTQPFRFALDGTGSGSAGLLNASTITIANGIVDFVTAGALDDSAYIIASYTSLAGAAFASVNNAPAGYILDYNYLGGNQIACVLVPEPNGAAMLLAGGGLVLIRRRRSRRSRQEGSA